MIFPLAIFADAASHSNLPIYMNGLNPRSFVVREMLMIWIKRASVLSGDETCSFLLRRIEAGNSFTFRRSLTFAAMSAIGDWPATELI